MYSVLEEVEALGAAAPRAKRGSVSSTGGTRRRAESALLVTPAQRQGGHDAWEDDANGNGQTRGDNRPEARHNRLLQ